MASLVQVPIRTGFDTAFDSADDAGTHNCFSPSSEHKVPDGLAEGEANLLGFRRPWHLRVALSSTVSNYPLTFDAEVVKETVAMYDRTCMAVHALRFEQICAPILSHVPQFRAS